MDIESSEWMPLFNFVSSDPQLKSTFDLVAVNNQPTVLYVNHSNSLMLLPLTLACDFCIGLNGDLTFNRTSTSMLLDLSAIEMESERQPGKDSYGYHIAG